MLKELGRVSSRLLGCVGETFCFFPAVLPPPPPHSMGHVDRDHSFLRNCLLLEVTHIHIVSGCALYFTIILAPYRELLDFSHPSPRVHSLINASLSGSNFFNSSSWLIPLRRKVNNNNHHLVNTCFGLRFCSKPLKFHYFIKSSQHPMRYVFYSHLADEKRRLREVKSPAQGHSAREW